MNKKIISLSLLVAFTFLSAFSYVYQAFGAYETSSCRLEILSKEYNLEHAGKDTKKRLVQLGVNFVQKADKVAIWDYHDYLNKWINKLDEVSKTVVLNNTEQEMIRVIRDFIACQKQTSQQDIGSIIGTALSSVEVVETPADSTDYAANQYEAATNSPSNEGNSAATHSDGTQDTDTTTNNSSSSDNSRGSSTSTSSNEPMISVSPMTITAGANQKVTVNLSKGGKYCVYNYLIKWGSGGFESSFDLRQEYNVMEEGTFKLTCYEDAIGSPVVYEREITVKDPDFNGEIKRFCLIEDTKSVKNACWNNAIMRSVSTKEECGARKNGVYKYYFCAASWVSAKICRVKDTSHLARVFSENECLNFCEERDSSEICTYEDKGSVRALNLAGSCDLRNGSSVAFSSQAVTSQAQCLEKCESASDRQKEGKQCIYKEHSGESSVIKSYNAEPSNSTPTPTPAPVVTPNYGSWTYESEECLAEEVNENQGIPEVRCVVWETTTRWRWRCGGSTSTNPKRAKVTFVCE